MDAEEFEIFAKNFPDLCSPVSSGAALLSTSSPTSSMESKSHSATEFGRYTASVLKLLRFFGFFPAEIDPCFPVTQHKTTIKAKLYGVWRHVLPLISSLVPVSIGLSLIGLNIFIVNLLISYVGFLHVRTLTGILTGLKPVQGLANLVCFALGNRRHQKFLRLLNDVEILESRNPFTRMLPNYRFNSFQLFFWASLTIIASFFVRFTQYNLSGEKLFQFWLSDASLLLVPLLGIWQFLPIFYFVYICSLLKFWFRQLKREFKNDGNGSQPNSLQYYFLKYSRLAKISKVFSDFTGPFLFCSLATSIVVLCLTIYFGVNAPLVLQHPPNATADIIWDINFVPIWAGLQVFTALITIFALCVSGILLNETARNVLPLLLSIAPQGEKGRFTLLCFLHKVQSQPAWSIAAGRAIQMERGLLLTIFSMIFGYAAILLRLAQTSHCGNHEVIPY